MAINISDLGGGGYFFPSGGLVGERIASGQTGVLISAPEVSGVVYKITGLSCTGTGTQDGITLIADGVAIEDEQKLDDTSPTPGANISGFGVSETFGPTSTAAYSVYRNITCKSFSVVKNTGNTIRMIDIIYQVGELK